MNIKVDNKGRFYLDQRIGGKRCHVVGYSKKEVREKVAVWMLAQQEEEEEEELGALFDEVAAEWFEDAQQRLKRGTMVCYAPRYKDAVQHFKGRRIKEITAADITEYLKLMKRKGYAYKTTSNAKIVLSQIWQYWIESPKYKGDRNPVSLARLPQGLTRTKRLPPSDETIELIKAHPEGFGLLANMVLYTGLRLGEVNGIQVKDIDFDRLVYGVNGCININKAMLWRGNQPYKETTKTQAGERTVPIFAPLRPLLEQAVEGLKPNDYVCSGAAEPLTKMQFQRRWQSYCRSIGLAHSEVVKYKKNGKECQRTEWIADITPHQFRHYFATVCYDAGIPEHTACLILGHASAETTKQTYIHIREQKMTESVSALEKMFTNDLPREQKINETS